MQIWQPQPRDRFAEYLRCWSPQLIEWMGRHPLDVLPPEAPVPDNTEEDRAWFQVGCYSSLVLLCSRLVHRKLYSYGTLTKYQMENWLKVLEWREQSFYTMVYFFTGSLANFFSLLFGIEFWNYPYIYTLTNIQIFNARIFFSDYPPLPSMYQEGVHKKRSPSKTKRFISKIFSKMNSLGSFYMVAS